VGSSIRVGVVGLGYLGSFHLEKYFKLNNITVTAVSDINQSALDKVRDKSIFKSLNYKDIIDYVDAVSIVSNTDNHYTIAKFFLENGKDILVEKPITSTVEQADELIKIAEDKALILQVGHLERFNPAIVAFQEYVKKPMFIESIRISPFFGRSTDIDVVRDLMIHDIDIILSIVKSKVKSVHGVGGSILTDKIDIANARIVFDSGCVVNITSSRVSFKKERKIRIFQSDLYASIDYDKKNIKIYRLDKKGKTVIKPLDFLSCFKIKKLKLPSDVDQLQLEIESFINSVITRSSPAVSGVDARNALEVALKILSDIEVNINDTIC